MGANRWFASGPRSPTADSKSAGTGFYNALIASVEKVFAQDRPLLDRLAASLLARDPEFDQLAAALEAPVEADPEPAAEPRSG